MKLKHEYHGYTLMDAKVHSDHKLCREYPFFEWERPELPESEAVW